MLQTSLDHFQLLSECTTPHQRWEKFIQLLDDSYGIKNIMYCMHYSKKVSQEQSLFRSALMLTTLPTKHLKSHKDFIEYGRCSQHCLTETNPFIWHDDSLWQNLSPQEQASKDFFHDLGFIYGSTIPLHTDNNYLGWGGMGLHFDSKDQKDFSSLWQLRQHEIIELSMMFDMLIRQESINDIYTLTFRQKDILTWAYAGLGSEQIADKINRSVKIVNLEFEKIRQVLDTKTNMQSMGKALQLGLIEP